MKLVNVASFFYPDTGDSENIKSCWSWEGEEGWKLRGARRIQVGMSPFEVFMEMKIKTVVFRNVTLCSWYIGNNVVEGSYNTPTPVFALWKYSLARSLIFINVIIAIVLVLPSLYLYYTFVIWHTLLHLRWRQQVSWQHWHLLTTIYSIISHMLAIWITWYYFICNTTIVFYLIGDKFQLTYASLIKTARFTHKLDKLQFMASLKAIKCICN